MIGLTEDPIAVSTLDLVLGTRSMAGTLTGSAGRNEDNVAFSGAQGMRRMVEVMPLAEPPRAYERMTSGAARFRVILDTTS